MSRQFQGTAVIGATGQGKSTFIVDFMRAYYDKHPDLNIYLFDPNDTFLSTEHAEEVLSEHTTLGVHYKEVKVKELDIDIYNPAVCLMNISNGLLIIDDLRVYFNTSNSNPITKLLIQKRHKNLDIILVYHSFTQVHKPVYDLLDNLIIFNIKEEYDQANKRILPNIVTKDIYSKIRNQKVGEYTYLKIN